VRYYSVRRGYSTAGQHSPFACQRELTNSDSTSTTVHVTDNRHCASERAHDHTLVEDSTGAKEEDFQICSI
jgi:hypothetical protein